MKHYKRLSIEEREEISRSIAAGLTLRKIALKLGRSPSSICREVKRLPEGYTVKYRAVLAHRHAEWEARGRKLGRRKLFKNKRLEKIVRKKLALFWSPEQIAMFLKKNYESASMHVSAETIYSYVYVFPRRELRAELTKQLRRGREKRKSQKFRNCGKNRIEEMLSIEERPKEVADRIIPGHWEGDLIIGKNAEGQQTALGTLVERTTRSVILVPLKDKTAKEVRKKFARELKKLPREMRLSLTYDRGSEMSQHKLFSKETRMKVFFAHPRSPWERGTNENTNGLLRQYFPTSTDFTKVSLKEIKRAQKQLNERPRKTLDWRTPQEAMQELLR
jgi:IS30 family transposase